MLPAAAAWLRSHYGGDLGGLIVAVPTRRAGRRLLELLVDAADGIGDEDTQEEGREGGKGGVGGEGGVVPPQWETPGSLPECLYRTEAEDYTAGDWSAWVARAASLRSADRSMLEQVVPHPPSEGARGGYGARVVGGEGGGDAAGWMRLAEQLGQVSTELSGARLDPAGVVDRARQREIDLGLSEARWEAFAQLETHYRQTLGRDDRQQARERALREGDLRGGSAGGAGGPGRSE